jgi:hypothetical protein
MSYVGDPITVEFTQDELAHFLKAEEWKSSKAQDRPKPQVFVSYWMSDPEGPGRLAHGLRHRLSGAAKVVVGSDEGQQNWSRRVQDLIKDRSTALICADLTPPRPDVYCEIGWAIGAHKPILFCISNPGEWEALPKWVRELELRPVQTVEQWDQLATTIRRRLDRPVSRQDRWVYSPDGIMLDRSIDVRSVSIVGSGDTWDSVVQRAEDIASRRGFSVRTISLGRAHEVGEVLYELIPVARQSSLMLLSFPGDREIDMMLCVIGAILSAFSDGWVSNPDTKRKLKFHRRAILFNDSGGRPSAEILPASLRRSGFHLVDSHQSAIEYFQEEIVYLEGRVTSVQTRRRRQS